MRFKIKSIRCALRGYHNWRDIVLYYFGHLYIVGVECKHCGERRQLTRAIKKF